ncbi:MAG: class I SAM-dependent methyltransferase [Thermomicrobiaceae bacterium]
MTDSSVFRGGPLQAVACDLCGSNKDRTFLTLPDMMSNTSNQMYRLARCRSCDLIYLNPRPLPWQFASYYPETYAPFARSRLGARARTWLHSRTVRELEHFLDAPNRVLDVGCGTGELMHEIRKAGNPNIIGIEPSPGASRIAREQRKLDVSTGTLEQQRYPAESFDTVLLSHVLEHLPSPVTTIAEVRRVLKPGGVIIIWVPNAASFAARLLGRYWMGWDVPRHLYAFTPGSLHRLIEGADLLPGEIFHERHGLEWAWGIRLWAESRFPGHSINSVLATIHPFTGVALSSVGAVSAAIGASGRIRMIVRKPIDDVRSNRFFS